MWFKLTVVLLALILATMYFAGTPDESTLTPEVAASSETSDTAEIAEETETIDPPDPAEEASIAQDVTPRAALRDTRADPVEAATDAAVSEALTADSAAPEAAPEPGLPGLTLDALRIPDDGAAAVSLADRVRARIGEDTIDTSRPTLGGQPSEPEIEVIVEPALAEAPPQTAPALAVPEPAPGNESPPEARFALVIGSNVNLRAGPSTGNAVVGQVQAGQRVRLLGETQPGWSSILNPVTGEPVFMSSRFLAAAAP